MRLKVYYNGQQVNTVTNELRRMLEERVEMQLIEALMPFDHLIAAYDYTIKICFSENYESIIIIMDGLPDQLAKTTEQAIARVINEKPVYVEKDFVPSFSL